MNSKKFVLRWDWRAPFMVGRKRPDLFKIDDDAYNFLIDQEITFLHTADGVEIYFEREEDMSAFILRFGR